MQDSNSGVLGGTAPPLAVSVHRTNSTRNFPAELGGILSLSYRFPTENKEMSRGTLLPIEMKWNLSQRDCITTEEAFQEVPPGKLGQERVPHSSETGGTWMYDYGRFARAVFEMS